MGGKNFFEQLRRDWGNTALVATAGFGSIGLNKIYNGKSLESLFQDMIRSYMVIEYSIIKIP